MKEVFYQKYKKENTYLKKVKITEEQRDALMYVAQTYNCEEIVKKHSSMQNFWINAKWDKQMNVESLNPLSVDEVIRALYIGFDVIKTPSEKLIDCYTNYLDHFQSPYKFNEDEKRGFRLGVSVACFVLDEKIKGIAD